MANKQPDYGESLFERLTRGFSETFLGSREAAERGAIGAIQTLSDTVEHGVSNGLGDIRDRVVLGGWFGPQSLGQTPTEREPQRSDLYGWEPGEREAPSFDQRWAVKETELDRQQADAEIDR